MTWDQGTTSLIPQVYTAAADETRWPSVLERLADEFRGGVTGFMYRTGAAGHTRGARFVRLDPALVDALRTDYATLNPWARLSQPLYRPGFIYTPDRELPLPKLRRTAFYEGILRPAGVVYCFGACVFRRGDDVLSFTVVRSPAMGPYEENELARVRAILPHLSCAAQVNERLARLERTRTTLADGLEHLRDGVLVLDRRGRVVWANRAARGIAAQQDGFALTSDGVAASRSTERARLRVLLDDAVRTGEGKGVGAGGAMTMSRPSLKRPFRVLVAPLPLTLDGNGASGLATVFISDPEARLETSHEIIRRLYGLTAREASVASAFAAHANLEQVSSELGISRETVRWHLRQLYRKTGTHRQAALLGRLVEGSSRVKLQTAPAADVRSGLRH
jgi:DNA-binding CsgD family transcriptional regulator/PAS domain-containing protein